MKKPNTIYIEFLRWLFKDEFEQTMWDYWEWLNGSLDRKVRQHLWRSREHYALRKLYELGYEVQPKENFKVQILEPNKEPELTVAPKPNMSVDRVAWYDNWEVKEFDK